MIVDLILNFKKNFIFFLFKDSILNQTQIDSFTDCIKK